MAYAVTPQIRSFTAFDALDEQHLLPSLATPLPVDMRHPPQPVKQFFTGAFLSWQGVYARFNAWRKDGSWQAVWLHVLRLNKAHLDCSSVQLDGSHTHAKNGGRAVGYQARKKARTTTALFLADNRDQPLACASPQAGNHHDSHLLNALCGEICAFLEAAGISVAGLFLNADKAFDTNGFCQECARRDVEANIPRNRRAADWQADDAPFSTPNATAAVSWSNTPTPGSTASKPCSCATKPASAIGWPGTGSPSLSSFCEKSTKSRLSKQLHYLTRGNRNEL